MNNEIYCLLWSKKANQFHVEPLSKAAKSGMQFLLQAKTNDYLLVAYGSWSEMTSQADELRPILVQRDHERRPWETGDGM